jgi:hypothetical protein
MNSILHLGSSSLAKQVQIIQDRESLTELTQICIAQMELPNLFEISQSKQKWKPLVKGS